MLAAIVVLSVLGFVLGGLLGIAAKFFAVEEGNPLIKEIESLLPGSQCGQCGMPGCSSAAEAIAVGKADINCCPPGGRSLVEKLADMLGIDPATIGETPQPLLAAIDETLCTGCTRCYKQCPTDAIVGANKQIHSVIARACTGCAKCKDICPENCIALTPEPVSLNNWHWPKPQVA